MEEVRCGSCKAPISETGACLKCVVQMPRLTSVVAVPKLVAAPPEQPTSFGFRCGVCKQGWSGFEQSCPHCRGVEQKGV